MALLINPMLESLSGFYVLNIRKFYTAVKRQHSWLDIGPIIIRINIWKKFIRPDRLLRSEHKFVS